MGIDAKCIGGFLWKMTKVSMKFCYTCVKKHPYVAGVLLVLFLLFIFLPSVFFFLIYSSPIVTFITVSIQIYFKIKRLKTENDKKNDEKASPSVESKPAAVTRKGEKPVITKQLSRRRNFKQNIESDRDKDGGSQNAVTEEKSEAFIADKGVGFSDDLMGKRNLKSSAAAGNVQGVCDDLKGKACQNEEKSKGVVEEKGESSWQKIQALDQPGSDFLSHDGSIEQPGKNCGGGGGGDGDLESSDDDDEEDQARRDGKALEWTEDDQKNLMDLGDSDLERNKRLESLIAKRRARKLFKMALEKRVIDSGNNAAAASASAAAVPIPPIFALRNNLSSAIPNSLEESCLPMPGSAPSVLLPGRNPFDLPYDPLEEKPDLMADSFQQEFMAAQQKEVLFCRHESFCLGPSTISESQQDQHDSRFGPFGIDKKNEDGHRFSRFRSQSYMSCHDQLIDELLFQEDEALSRSPRNVSATDLVELEREEASKKKSVEDSKPEEDKDSVASSEASELSFSLSIPTNIEILEAKVGKFPQRLSDRVQSGLTFSVPTSFGFYGSSYEPSPPGIDKPPRFGDRLFYREKGFCHSPRYSIASDMQVEVSEAGSPPFTVDGTASPVDVEYLYDGDIDKEDITSGNENMWGASRKLAGTEENEWRSREVNEVSEDDIPEVGSPTTASASSKLPEEVTAKALPPEFGQEHSENLNENIFQNAIQVAEEVQNSSHQKPEEPSESPENQVVHANNSDKSAENQTLTELEKKIEDIMNSEPINGEPEKINEQENIGGTSRTIEGVENLESAQEGTDEQSIVEVGENQRFNNPIISALQSELLDETDSSSYLSPRSGLRRNITSDEIPSSSFDQLVHHIDVPRSIVDDIFRTNSLDEEPPEGLTRTAPRNLPQLLVDPTDHTTSTSTHLGKSEEPSESWMSPEAAVELSEPVDRTHLGSSDHIKGKSPTLHELEAGISPAKPAEKIANSESDVPETMAKEEETWKSQEKSTREANVEKEDEEQSKTADIETSADNEEVGEVTASKSMEDRDENKGKLTDTTPASSEGSLEIIEDSQGDAKNIKQDEFATGETAAEKKPTSPPGKYTREASTTTNNIKSSEGESHVSMTEANEEQLKAAEATTSESIEDGKEIVEDNSESSLEAIEDSQGESTAGISDEKKPGEEVNIIHHA